MICRRAIIHFLEIVLNHCLQSLSTEFWLRYRLKEHPNFIVFLWWYFFFENIYLKHGIFISFNAHLNTELSGTMCPSQHLKIDLIDTENFLTISSMINVSDNTDDEDSNLRDEYALGQKSLGPKHCYQLSGWIGPLWYKDKQKIKTHPFIWKWLFHIL